MKALFIFLILSLSLMAHKDVRLQLGWKHQFQFAGYYMAKEKGFYKKAGIDVTILENSGSIIPSQSVSEGNVEYAVGRSSILIKQSLGERFTALGAIFQYSPMMLLVTDVDQIKTLEDLSGKRIMITNDAESSVDILAMLFSKNLDKDDVIFQQHSFNLQDLIDGKTDAMASYITNEPIRLKARGIPYRIFHPREYGFEFYSDILFASEAFVEQYPEATADFYKATIKGWKYAFDHIEETARVIHKKYNSQHRSLEMLIEEGRALKPLAYAYGKEKLGYIDRYRIQNSIEAYKVMGLIQKEPDMDHFIYEGNHPKMIDINLTRLEIAYLLGAALLSIILLFVIVLFFSIRKKWLITKTSLLEVIDEQTEKLETQNRLLLTQSRLAAVGETLSNIAHQWRQPLAGITATTMMVRVSMQLDKPISHDELDEKLTSIEADCQYLSDTISDFMTYFSSNEYHSEPFDVKEALEKVESLTSDMCRYNRITFKSNLESVTLINNKNLLVQALINVINNAKDAFEHNEIDPDKRLLLMQMQQTNGHIIIVLKDSAGGIQEEILDKVFEPYFTTKHQSKGTGLGLFMTYEIITQQFLGSIRVDNVTYTYEDESYKGAAFTITLPIAPESDVKSV